MKERVEEGHRDLLSYHHIKKCVKNVLWSDSLKEPLSVNRYKGSSVL